MEIHARQFMPENIPFICTSRLSIASLSSIRVYNADEVVGDSRRRQVHTEPPNLLYDSTRTYRKRPFWDHKSAVQDFGLFCAERSF
jgi:hypothetical protein